MTPEEPLSTTARATAACAGPNICTACVAFFIVTLLNRSVSGFAGRLGVTTASSLVKPSVLLDNVLTKACPAWPDFDPMIRSMCATSFPSPTRDSPMKKSAAITTSRSGWGPRVHLPAVTNAVVRAAWSEGVEGHAVPRLRVAPTEPYRCGANLPAAPAGVKAARRALAWGLGPAHRYEQRRDQPPETTRDDTHYGTPAHSAPPAPQPGRGAGALGPAARPTQNGSRAGHRRQSDLRSADGRPGLLVRRARNAGGRNVQVPECHPRSEEHTSELQSRGHLVCRLLLEKKKGS